MHQAAPFASKHTQSALSWTCICYSKRQHFIKERDTYRLPFSSDMLNKVHSLLDVVESDQNTNIFLGVVLRSQIIYA